ncbi:TPA: hypothetical protein RQK74_004247 [Vibrio vulnificus]|nr:hypothetical protein [Vibrio vulnificus]
MSDIDKIQLIHDVKQKFTLGEDFVDTLINQIQDNTKKQSIERFFQGYSVEDYFQDVISALPWTRLTHQLDQSQFPSSSKTDFQVPDYQVFFEDFDRKCHPSLVEVKSVTGQKKSLKISKRQVDLCVAYADTCNHPLLYAIYWKHWNYWTLNTIDQFESKASSLKITLENAMKNDLSVIYGNVTYFIPPLTRTTICDSSISDDSRPCHQDYGTILTDRISTDGCNFVALSVTDSSVLDSYFSLSVESVKTVGSRTCIIEKTDAIHAPKVLSIVMAHMALIGEALENVDSRYSFFFVHEFLDKLGVSHSYSIPNSHTTMSRDLYSIAFKGTSLADDGEFDKTV